MLPIQHYRVALAAALLAGGTAPAQRPAEGAKQFQVEQTVIRQKIEGEVAQAIEDAIKLKATSKDRAIRLLKSKVDDVKADPVLSLDNRQPILDKLNAQIKAIETGETAAKPKSAATTDLAQRREQDANRDKAILSEVREVRRELETIQALADARNLDQAKKQADALVKRYPNNPAAIALSQTTITSEAIGESKTLSRQMDDAWVKVMNDVSRTGIPAKGDIEFNAKYYREVVAKRNPSTLTAKEKAVMKALDTEILFSVKDKPLEEVLNDLSESLKTPILLDEIARQDLKIDSGTTVTLNLRTVPVRTALRQVLRDKGLAFVMKNESILVTTAERAKDMLVARVYYVGDLVTGLGPFNAVRSGPFADQRQTQELVDQLKRSILTVDPMSWELNSNGGHGTITFHWPSMSFIIRQSAEVHAKLAGTFGNGK